MKHIKTISERVLKDTMKHGGCGECQTSCQSACKTSCTVGHHAQLVTRAVRIRISSLIEKTIS